MNNKKVYLAKSNQASGADVEYVRTNLLRIPGIELVDYSSGIKSSECAGIVVVTEPVWNFLEDEPDFVLVTKNVGSAIQEALSEHEDSGIPVYVYSGDSPASNPLDCEKSMPMAIGATDFILDMDETGLTSGIELMEDDEPLLVSVSILIGYTNAYLWTQNPRYLRVDPLYALSEIPTFESRRAKKVATRFEAVEDIKVSTPVRTTPNTNYSRTPSAPARNIPRPSQSGNIGGLVETYVPITRARRLLS